MVDGSRYLLLQIQIIISRDNHSEFFVHGEADDGGIPPTSNFASKMPNKSVNQLKLAATKKSKKRGNLNKTLI